MPYLPINLRITGKACVVIGGGTVATRKVESLIEAGACVVVIAPEISPALERLTQESLISHERRQYRSGDLAGAILVFAATSNRETNGEIAREAAAGNILVDVVDDPKAGNFVSPATVRRGDLVLTVSTGGQAPALSRAVKKQIGLEYGPEYAAAVRIHQAVREKLLTENKPTGYTTSVLRAFAESELPQLLKSRSHTEIDRLLLHFFGPGYSLAGLGVADKEVP